MYHKSSLILWFMSSSVCQCSWMWIWIISSLYKILFWDIITNKEFYSTCNCSFPTIHIENELMKIGMALQSWEYFENIRGIVSCTTCYNHKNQDELLLCNKSTAMFIPQRWQKERDDLPPPLNSINIPVIPINRLRLREDRRISLVRLVRHDHKNPKGLQNNCQNIE